MLEKENFSILKTIRNGTAAVVLIPVASLSHIENTQANNLEPGYQTENHLQLSETPEHLKNNGSFFEFIDDLVESDKGKAIASALVVAAIGSALYNHWQSQERDNKRKKYEMLASSGLFLTLSSLILAQSFTDIDPKIPASILQAYALTRSIYATEDSFQRDRKLKKRISNLTASAGLLAASTTILVDSID